MMLKVALLVSMLFQLGAAVFALTLIRRTRYNISWILISAGFVLMAIRRLFDFSLLFWETSLFKKEEVNTWIGVVISIFLLAGVIFIRKIFNLQEEVERLRTENEQRVLSAVINTEETARQKFARELHDGLGPSLSSIKMTLSAVKHESLTPMNSKIISNVCNLTDYSLVTLKEIANNLSPHLLKNYGLGKAIETFADQLFSASGVKHSLFLNIDEQQLSDEKKISLYRIICELMNNSLKHANPSSVSLELTESDKLIVMNYKDDGCGFENFQTRKDTKPTGMGFANITSRTRLLNGMYYIDTAPGKGFFIEFYFPKKKSDKTKSDFSETSL
jgi:signal transduction histidine kinase